MELNSDACYQALMARDPRFDGVFFVGVSTTRIYCRTVCPARTPGRDRCTFYPSAAAAERAGYRPCLRCRPELAPGNARIDAIGRLASAAADRIEEGALSDGGVAGLAADMGVSERHLRRVIKGEFGVSPVELSQTQRLLLAKRLLADTTLPIGEIAFASGFASLRRFNALFQSRYRLSPSQVRKQTSVVAGPRETLVCRLAYRPPLDWDAMLQFLGPRTVAGVEAVIGNRYLRTASVGKARGWIAVEPSSDKHSLRVEVSASLLPGLLPVLTRVKRLFDLSADPQHIACHLGGLAVGCPGLRVPGAFDGFEMAVRAILGQQVSVKAATTLAGRFATAFGERLLEPEEPQAGTSTPHPEEGEAGLGLGSPRAGTPTPHPEVNTGSLFSSSRAPVLTHLTPTAERVANASVEELAALGILPSRARSILALARAVVDGAVVLEPTADVDKTMAQLKELPGIGEWTAQYIAMRALSFPDAFPHTDLGIYKALGEDKPSRVLAAAEAWRPWRSYAVMHLWRSLEAK